MPAGWQDVLIGAHVPDLNWNKTVWGSTYGWQAGGEEWSETWGSSEAQWFGSIFPRLHRFLPARRILEIAPGFGQWTKFLIPACDEFVGVDLSAKCVDACRKIFATAGHAQFISNDGCSLDAVPIWKVRSRVLNSIRWSMASTTFWRRIFRRFCASYRPMELRFSITQIFSPTEIQSALRTAAR